MSGPSHGSPVGLALWNANDQRLEAGALGDQTGRLEQLVPVRVALVEDPRGKAVRGEDHVRVRSADPVGEHVQVRLVVVPALDEPELGAACEALLEPLAVAVDRERRVVRREDEADDRVRAARERLLGRLRDSRAPVLHADVDGQTKLPLERRAGRLRHVVERRAPADPPVALGQLLDGLVRDRPARRGCPRGRGGCPPGRPGSRRP